MPLDRVEPILIDTRTTALRFRYLGPEPESWEDAWDPSRDDALPRAVEITLVSGDGRLGTQQSFTVPIQASGP